MHLPSTPSLPRYPLTRVSKVLAVGMLGTVAGLSAAHAQAAGAQTSAPVPANRQGPGTSVAQSGPVVLNGGVVDPDGAEIPGATLTLTSATGKAYVVQSGSDGTYSFRGVPPGLYALTVTMPGFASFVRQGVRVAETATTINAKLLIANQQTVVNVTTDENHVSVDADSSAGTTVLKGKDLDALSDDPDELSSELTALAGPSSGPNGGQIYIDGFTGGQLPPKSSIREIRINQNPFSAEYDKPGFGRVEIFTKPGTEKFRLYAQINGNTKDLNTGSPYTDNATQPGYQTIFSFGQFSGPLTKTSSFTVGSSFRQIQSDSIIDPPAIFATSQTSGVACLPGQTGCNTFATTTGNGYSSAQFVPQIRWDVRPRFDLALGSKNTLTATFQYEHNNEQNQGIGGLDLASTGYNETLAETTLQLSDSQIVSDKIINETRFEYQHPTEVITPYSTAATIGVQGAFTGGGYNGGAENDIQNHIEFQNYTSIALAKNFIRFGGRLRYTGDTDTTTSGANGDFNYSSIGDYTAATLASFTETLIARPTVKTSTVDVGLYAETDWKIKPTWTLSYGLRFESQNYIHDKADWAPRFSTAYSLNKNTVLRAGAGIFYDRFLLGNQQVVVRNNGTNQTQYTSSSTSTTGSTISSACSPSNPVGNNDADPFGCTLAASTPTVNTVTSNLRAPYTIQENLGVDQQLFKNATASVNYQHIQGFHQFVSNAPNYATASVTQPLDYQYESEGFFNQNQLIVNVNVRNFHNASFGGFYALNFAKSDTGGISSFASVPNDLSADYGRASFDTRNRLFLYGSWTAPHFITLSPLVVATSGSPYNITSGLDEFNDNVFNGRAVFAPAGATPVAGGYVKTIAGCGTFATPGTDGNTTPVPINYCTGPTQFSFNLRAVKTWGFGGPANASAGQGQGGGPGGGPGGGRGGPGGGGGGRGGPGGPGGGGASTGKRYNLALGVQGQNLFNYADRATPVGTLTSPSFGQSTALTGGFLTTNSAVRRIQFQATFSF